MIPPIKALKFFEIVGKLKTTKRTGWVNNDIPLPESISDHMYRMAMLSFLIVDPTVNKDRLMKVCLIHDLAEAVIGDITPYDGISKEEKRRLEEDALRNIANDIGHAEVSQEIIDLWMEYEEGTSIEADLARQLDKFEMIVQADEYEVSNPGKRLERFFESTVDSFSHPEIVGWANELRTKRSLRWNENKTH